MKRITFIGSGSVATNLAKSFYKSNFEIVQICSVNILHANELAAAVAAEATTSIETLNPVDVFMIAVNDDAIAEVVKKLPAGDALVLHTAGSVSMDALQRFARYGVLYPLQTFTKKKEVDFSNVPLFIEANTSENLEKVRLLAATISTSVSTLSTEERMKLHVAAVFACNFLNYLLSAAADLSKENFQALHPLVNEMVAKAFASQHPRQVQTGPALRGDKAILKKHEDLLSLHPELQKIYIILSEAIANQHHVQI